MVMSIRKEGNDCWWRIEAIKTGERASVLIAIQ